MSDMAPRLLTDTLNLIALARETALARGRPADAERLDPMVTGLRNLVVNTRNGVPPEPVPNPASGLLAGSDFQALLAAVQAGPRPGLTDATASALDRGQVASAMAAGGMAEVDIARQLGVTREEVRLMLARPVGGR